MTNMIPYISSLQMTDRECEEQLRVIGASLRDALLVHHTPAHHPTQLRATHDNHVRALLALQQLHRLVQDGIAQRPHGVQHLSTHVKHMLLFILQQQPKQQPRHASRAMLSTVCDIIVALVDKSTRAGWRCMSVWFVSALLQCRVDNRAASAAREISANSSKNSMESYTASSSVTLSSKVHAALRAIVSRPGALLRGEVVSVILTSCTHAKQPLLRLRAMQTLQTLLLQLKGTPAEWDYRVYFAVCARAIRAGCVDAHAGVRWCSRRCYWALSMLLHGEEDNATDLCTVNDNALPPWVQRQLEDEREEALAEVGALSLCGVSRRRAVGGDSVCSTRTPRSTSAGTILGANSALAHACQTQQQHNSQEVSDRHNGEVALRDAVQSALAAQVRRRVSAPTSTGKPMRCVALHRTNGQTDCRETRSSEPTHAINEMGMTPEAAAAAATNKSLRTTSCVRSAVMPASMCATLTNRAAVEIVHEKEINLPCGGSRSCCARAYKAMPVGECEGKRVAHRIYSVHTECVSDAVRPGNTRLTDIDERDVGHDAVAHPSKASGYRRWDDAVGIATRLANDTVETILQWLWRCCTSSDLLLDGAAPAGLHVIDSGEARCAALRTLRSRLPKCASSTARWNAHAVDNLGAPHDTSSTTNVGSRPMAFSRWTESSRDRLLLVALEHFSVEAHEPFHSVRRAAFALLRAVVLQCRTGRAFFIPWVARHVTRLLLLCRAGLDDAFVEVQIEAEQCLHALVAVAGTQLPMDLVLSALVNCVSSWQRVGGGMAVHVSAGRLAWLRALWRLVKRILCAQRCALEDTKKADGQQARSRSQGQKTHLFLDEAAVHRMYTKSSSACIRQEGAAVCHSCCSEDYEDVRMYADCDLCDDDEEGCAHGHAASCDEEECHALVYGARGELFSKTTRGDDGTRRQVLRGVPTRAVMQRVHATMWRLAEEHPSPAVQRLARRVKVALSRDANCLSDCT